jgi:hypothetical protein
MFVPSVTADGNSAAAGSGAIGDHAVPSNLNEVATIALALTPPNEYRFPPTLVTALSSNADVITTSLAHEHPDGVGVAVGVDVGVAVGVGVGVAVGVSDGVTVGVGVGPEQSTSRSEIVSTRQPTSPTSESEPKRHLSLIV